MLQNAGVLYILPCKCASRHSGVPFFNIGTSKSGPSMWCFVHFDLQMCFAPQRRAIFADQDFQNGSDNEVFCTFWLTNVLRATAACHFCGSGLPKWLPEWGVLHILTYKCASRHSGVRFFGSLRNSFLRTRRFTEATSRTSGITNHWKTQRFAALLTFRARVPSFNWLYTRVVPPFNWLYTRVDLLASDLTAVLLCFQLSILSEVRLLNFLRSYII